MSSIELFLVGLLPIALMLVGVLVIWYAVTQEDQSERKKYRAVVSWQLLGGLLIVLGTVAGIVSTTFFFAVLVIPAAIVILSVLRSRYYDADQQSLMWGLLTAAERGIPLNLAAQAFADERAGVLSGRAAQLADYLEAGVPLGLSLRRSGHRVEPALSLAADVGYQTGTLGPALRKVLDRASIVEAITIPMASRLIYLGVTVVNILILQTFLMLRILPAMARINESSGTEFPTTTKRLMASTQFGSLESYLWLVFITIGLFGLALGMAALFGRLRSFPVVRRLWWRVDSSLILRWLAVGVRQGRPLLEMLRLLAAYFPQPGMCKALDRAAQRVEQGTHWCDSLVRARLIRSSESAVFKAAERAGNLEWALDEMADSSVRRWVYRIQMWMSFLFPFALILLSCGVLAVLLSVFTQLITYIQQSA